MNPHPLMEIRFVQGDITATRHWYHVPSIGDAIDLTEIQGKVAAITWSDRLVVIRLKGEK